MSHGDQWGLSIMQQNLLKKKITFIFILFVYDYIVTQLLAWYSAGLMSTCTTGLEQRNRHNSHYTRLNSIHRRHFASVGCVVCSVQNTCQSWLHQKHLLVLLTLWTSCSSFLELLPLVRESLADVVECVWSSNWLTPETATCWINNLEVFVWGPGQWPDDWDSPSTIARLHEDVLHTWREHLNVLLQLTMETILSVV